MEEILLKWIYFMAYWKANTKIIDVNGQKSFVKPEFYDFMEWLVNHK